MKESRGKGRGLGKGGEPYTEPNTMKTTTESKRNLQILKNIYKIN
jgi:hypothetical protein